MAEAPKSDFRKLGELPVSERGKPGKFYHLDEHGFGLSGKQLLREFDLQDLESACRYAPAKTLEEYRAYIAGAFKQLKRHGIRFDFDMEIDEVHISEDVPMRPETKQRQDDSPTKTRQILALIGTDITPVQRDTFDAEQRRAYVHEGLDLVQNLFTYLEDTAKNTELPILWDVPRMSQFVYGRLSPDDAPHFYLVDIDPFTSRQADEFKEFLGGLRSMLWDLEMYTNRELGSLTPEDDTRMDQLIERIDWLRISNNQEVQKWLPRRARNKSQDELPL